MNTRESILINEKLKQQPKHFVRLANHTPQTNIHMMVPTFYNNWKWEDYLKKT